MSAEGEKALREYLAWHASVINPARYRNVTHTAEALVLERGTWYAPPETPRPAGIKKMRDKLCFQNAIQVATSHGWTYVEGFSVHVIPTLHAWCVDTEGRVVDPTWEEPGTAYLGLPMETNRVWSHLAKTKVYGVLGNAHEVGWDAVLAILDGATSQNATPKKRP